MTTMQMQPQDFSFLGSRGMVSKENVWETKKPELKVIPLKLFNYQTFFETWPD